MIILWTLMCASPTTELLCMFSKSYKIQPFVKTQSVRKIDGHYVTVVLSN